MTKQLERLSSLEQRLVDHELRCDERLAEIRSTSAHTLKAVEGLKSRIWMIAIALLAWALAQLWAANEGRLSRLEAPARPLAMEEARYASAR